MKQYIKNRFRERKRQIGLMGFLTLLVLSVTFLGLAIPKIMAGDTQVSDLTLQGESKEQSITLTLKDEHPEDTKIVIPLPEGITYTSNSNPNIGVTYDELSKQVVIDWVEGEEKQVQLQLEAEQDGQFHFIAQTVREGKSVNSETKVLQVLKKNALLENSEDKNEVTGEENESKVKQDISDENIVAQGSAGTAPWILDDSGTLHWYSGNLPTTAGDAQIAANLTWRPYADQILKISIEGEVTLGGWIYYLFSGLPRLQEVVGFENLNTKRTDQAIGWFKDATGIVNLDLSDLDMSYFYNMSSFFEGMTNLVSLELPEAKKVRYAPSLFKGCSSLENLDFGKWGWDLGQITTHGEMFRDMSSLQKIDLTNLNSGGGGNSDLLTGCTSLTELILGKSVSLSNTELVDWSKSKDYTGRWINQGYLATSKPKGTNKVNNVGLFRLFSTNQLSAENADKYILEERSAPILETKLSYSNSINDGKNYIGDEVNGKATLKNIVEYSRPEEVTFDIWLPKTLAVSATNLVLGSENSSLFSNAQEEADYMRYTFSGEDLNVLYGSNNYFSFKGKLTEAGNFNIKSRITYHDNNGILQPLAEDYIALNVQQLDIKKSLATLIPEDASKFDKNNNNFPNLITLTQGEATPIIFSVKNTNDNRDETIGDFTIELNSLENKNKLSVDKDSFYIMSSDTEKWTKLPPDQIIENEAEKNSYSIKNLNQIILKGKEFKVKYSVMGSDQFTPEKEMMTVNSVIKESGTLIVSDSVEVKSGELQFINVPDVLNFNNGKISNKTTEVTRKDEDWKIQVEDSRAEKSNWRLTVKLADQFKDTFGNEPNSDILLFRDDVGEKWIDTMNETPVYTNIDTTKERFDLSWKENEGLLLKVAPGVVKAGNYQSTLNWTLVDAPA